jgi:hypothetical protein
LGPFETGIEESLCQEREPVRSGGQFKRLSTSKNEIFDEKPTRNVELPFSRRQYHLKLLNLRLLNLKLLNLRLLNLKLLSLKRFLRKFTIGFKTSIEK